MDLSGKVVIVTGASSGIGRQLARQLAAKGAKLSLLARRQEALTACAGECGPADTLVVPADVTNPAQVASAVAATFDRFGRIDVLVNSAGVGYFGSIERMRMADLDRMLHVNVHGLLQVTQAALSYLKESHGMIVNISSSLSKRALPFLSAYGGAKAMVDQLSDGMRMELRPYGIRVLTYNPPETETDFDANAIHEEGMSMSGGGRPRKPKPVAEVAARMVAAIETERRDVVESKALMWMNVLAPKRADEMFYKAMVEPRSRKDSSGE